ncbi:hypothetical protein [Chryseobacterium sp. 18068]|uniref:hypothetical protein n=1 Tax=Chryseobacterium sp. 18068 TaxID=2681414 RepID=UPI001359B480|nr:hypothetical protein [Chryseobacterium sp. 18068]
MIKIDYDALNEKFKPLFLEQYESFIDAKIDEVNKSNYSIDISVYTSKTVQEPYDIVAKFLREENIENHSITNVIRSFQHDLDFYLLMSTFDERIKMDHKLFHKIWLHNQNY